MARVNTETVMTAVKAPQGSSFWRTGWGMALCALVANGSHGATGHGEGHGADSCRSASKRDKEGS